MGIGSRLESSAFPIHGFRCESNELYFSQNPVDMAAVDIGARDNPPINDDLDNVFNYDVDNDLFKDVDISMDVAPKPTTGQNNEKGLFSGGLGLDEEIKVRKKRAPVAKLDENR